MPMGWVSKRFFSRERVTSMIHEKSDNLPQRSMYIYIMTAVHTREREIGEARLEGL